MTLTLDRIKDLKTISTVKYIDDGEFDADEYYRDIIGVTVNDGNRVPKIRFSKEHPLLEKRCLNGFHWDKDASTLQ